MRGAVIWLVLCGCGGPSHDQLVETPTAKTRPTAVEAPPASTSDEERAHAVQQMDDMQATQQAHEEAKQSEKPAPKAGVTKKGAKKAPVEQGPPLAKKKAPVEQAP